MITNNRVMTKLAAGEVSLGAWINLNSPDSAEILAHLGVDWLVFDTEHGPWSLETVQELIRATAATPIVPIVRVAWNDLVMIKRALDIGAYGIIVPWVNTAEQAAAAVRAAKYPPLGLRGCGPRRAGLYGLEAQEYLERADDLIMVIAQIETLEAVENLPAILSVEGVDAVFVGPADLSSSLGLRGQPRHPRNLEAIDRVARACRAAGVPAGIYSLGPDDVRRHIEQGFQLVTLGSDMDFMIRGFRQALKLAQGAG